MIAIHDCGRHAARDAGLLPVPHEEQDLVIVAALFLEDTLDYRALLGWRPDLIAGTAYGDVTYFAVVFSRYAPVGDDSAYRRRVVYDLEVAGLEQAFYVAKGGTGQNLLSLDAYHPGLASEADTRFCAVFDTAPSRVNQWSCQYWRDVFPAAVWEHQCFHAMLDGWARPAAMLPLHAPLSFGADGYGYIRIMEQEPGNQIFGWWQVDTFAPWPPWPIEGFTGGTFSIGPFSFQELETIKQTLTASNLWPLQLSIVQAPMGGDRRCTLIAVPAGVHKPLHRKLTRRSRGNLDWSGGGPLVSAVSPARVRAAPDDFDDGDGFPELEYDRSVIFDYVSPAPEIDPTLLQWRRGPDGELAPEMPGTGAPPRRVRPDKPYSAGAQQMTHTWSPLVVGEGEPHQLLAAYFQEYMHKHGVRGLQFAVARDNELKLSVALTLAEEGYPPIEVDHRIPMASANKLLTAMAAIRQLGPRSTGPTVSTPLSELLEVGPESPSYPGLAVITPEELFRHRSGWYDDAPSGWNMIGDVLDKARLDPGDYRYFLTLPGPLEQDTFNRTPWYFPDYNNINYNVLGEITSKLFLGGANYAQYVPVLRDWWGLTPFEARTTEDGWVAAQINGQPQAHLGTPGIADLGAGANPRYLPLQFQTYYPADVPAGGGWVMSMETVCKILSRMSPLAADPLLNEEEVRMMAEKYTPPEGPAIYDTGRGCYPLRLGQVPHGTPPSEFKKYKEEGMPWDGGPYEPIHVLQHNGLGYGCRGLLFHIVPASGPVSPSLSMAIVANHSFGVDPDIHAILDILRKIEFLEIWPEGDLWNA